MAIFSGDRTPELRKWAATHAGWDAKALDGKDPNSLGIALTTSILKSVATIFVPEKNGPQSTVEAEMQKVYATAVKSLYTSAEMQKVFYEAAKSFDTDLCLFEMLCNVLFHLDVWVFANANRAFREDFFNGKVVQKCLEVFAGIIEPNAVFPAFNNRVDAYGRLFRDQKGAERELFYLTQFIYRSTWINKLEAYEVDQNPVIIRGVFDQLTIQTHAVGYWKTKFPAQVDAVKLVKEKLNELGQFVE